MPRNGRGLNLFTVFETHSLQYFATITIMTRLPISGVSQELRWVRDFQSHLAGGVSEEAVCWGRADVGSIPRLAADLLGDCGVAH